jgi:uroporphyrin-III C-methyltransferase/precorrin-2 dehydrogenase/sirohydrochlorin ferrochelatase
MTPATLAALGDDGVTTVILMGVGALPRLASDALRAGVPADRPVAIVERGHHADQRTTRTSLGAVVLEAGRIGVRNPAVIVVGEVARTGMLVPDLLAAGSRAGGTSL